MANKRINDLPSETDPASTDVFAIDGATTRKATRADVLKENLEAIRALTSAADKGIQFTGAGTAAVYDLTAAGKALLDDADAAAQRNTLGLVIGTDVQAYDADLDAFALKTAPTGDVVGTSDAQTLSNKTLTAPVLGAATATSINKVAVTPPATGATLTIADGKTLTSSDNATVSGTNTGDQTITLTGDVTGTGTGSFAATIGAAKVTSAMLNSDVFSTAHSWSGVQTFSSAPIVPTQSPSDNSTKAASTAYVDAQVAGGVAGVASLNGQTGALVLGVAPQGRITLASGVAIMTTSQSGATTVYYTPFAGNIVPIYDGTNMVPTVFAELSQATTDTTKSPAAVAASKVYDLFVWNDGGTIRCTRGPAWTNDTTRGYTLTMVDGILLNTSSITNGPAASRGTWVGTIASNSSSSIDYIFGSIGAGGVAAVFNVWNAYNRVDVSTMVRDNTNSWTYAVATTWRAANNSATARVSFVRGADEDSVQATYVGLAVAGTNPTLAVAGVGLDSTTAFSGTTASNGNASSAQSAIGMYSGNPGVGSHFLSAIELNSGTNASTWYGDLGLAYLQSGFHVTLRS